MERAVLRFGNAGMRPPTGGCSAVMTGGIYGRNYDSKPRYYDAQFSLVHAKGSYASIGASAIVTGRLAGINPPCLAVGLYLVITPPQSP